MVNVFNVKRFSAMWTNPNVNGSCSKDIWLVLCVGERARELQIDFPVLIPSFSRISITMVAFLSLHVFRSNVWWNSGWQVCLIVLVFRVSKTRSPLQIVTCKQLINHWINFEIQTYYWTKYYGLNFWLF